MKTSTEWAAEARRAHALLLELNADGLRARLAYDADTNELGRLLHEAESTLAERLAAEAKSELTHQAYFGLRVRVEKAVKAYHDANNEAVAAWQREIGLPDVGALNLVYAKDWREYEARFPELRKP